jgi:hypothetical protein
MTFDFKEMTLAAFGTTITMKPKNFYANPFAALIFIMNDDKDNLEEEISNSFAATHSKTITESHHEKVESLKLLRHKNICRMNKEPTLSRYYKNDLVYSLELGNYPHKNMDLELLPSAIPVLQKPYLIPRLHLDVFKKELDDYVKSVCFHVWVPLNGQLPHLLY